MKFTLSRTLMATAAAGALALSMASDAKAAGYAHAHSTLTAVITSVVGGGVAPIGIPADSASNQVNLNGVAVGDAQSVLGGDTPPLDPAQVCQGPACNPAGANDATQYADGSVGSTFARADSFLSGNLLAPGGVTATAVAEAELWGNAVVGAAAGTFGTTGTFANFSVVGAPATITFDITYDALASTGIVAEPTTFQSFTAEFGLNILIVSSTSGQVFDLDDDATESYDGNAFSGIFPVDNNSGSPFSETITITLPVGTYSLQVNQEVSIEGVSVPEPGTLAVLGLGLLGMGVARRRMKKA
ncbi:MAG: PEP-CTERM sorting domain-containing protein [Rhodobacterales bacterium]|nr:PEP-CTERM sorting domain-containing protein [Rhodobacterales bacterium]